MILENLLFTAEPIALPPPPSDSNGSEAATDQSAEDAKAERRRKRKSRWLPEEAGKAFIPGMPTMINAAMGREQEDLYLSKFYFVCYHFT